MFRRSAALMLAVLLGSATAAQAHRLDVDAVVLPFGKVQVESWFETGEIPHAAEVKIYREDGGLLTEGKLDSKGIFVFPFNEIEVLRIVVAAGAGHRAEVRLPADKLRKLIACTAVACFTPSPWLAGPVLVPVKLSEEEVRETVPVVERHTGVPYKNLAIGVGILLFVALVSILRGRARRSSAQMAARRD